MTPEELKQTRLALGFTQQQLAEALRLQRLAITRYETGARRIPGLVEVAVKQLAALPRIPLAGVVAAGVPIEPIPQTEMVEVPRSMVGRGETFALRVKGDSMRDEGILPGDVVVVRKQHTARNGQTVIALVNGEATIKIYRRTAQGIELVPANAALPPLVVTERDSFRIEGVVVGVIRHLGP
jgi:repressor LexA